MSDDDDEPQDIRIAGVGPHPLPWPEDTHFDPALLRDGDRRNVVDRYRYWRLEAIVADLEQRRHPFEVAVENFTRDANIGAIVRTANAMGAARVHIVGRRRWNRRGAMMTERYGEVVHHDELGGLVAHADRSGLVLIGVDNLPGARSITASDLPLRCVLLFGQEGPGLSEAAHAQCREIVAIEQYGSTRSLNASAAAAIAMHEWCRVHAG